MHKCKILLLANTKAQREKTLEANSLEMFTFKTHTKYFFKLFSQIFSKYFQMLKYFMYKMYIRY